MAIEGCSLKNTLVNGMKGLILENDKIRLVIIVDSGSKLASLIYKPTEQEFLWHNPRMISPRPSYGDAYVECSGFDDCLPTIWPCKFKGMNIPDHGDLWSQPWSYKTLEESPEEVSVELHANGKVFPYEATKRVTLTKGKSAVRLDYTIKNLSNKSFEFLYSAHAMLNINPYYEILLPEEVDQVRVFYTVNDRFGKIGNIISWPIAADKEGRKVDISKIGKPYVGYGDKLFTKRIKKGWCTATNRERKESITFTWPPDKLPYIGIWINHNGWGDYYHAALEPCSGCPDALDLAVSEWKEYSVLPPKQKFEWYLEIAIEEGLPSVVS